MPLQNIVLNFPQINASAQIGDVVYYTTGGQNIGGFDNADLVNTVQLGTIISIGPNSITVEYNDDPPHPGAPPLGAFISFAKNKTVNTSSLLGYYASVKFINSSKKTNVELFSVGAEISQSSK